MLEEKSKTENSRAHDQINELAVSALNGNTSSVETLYRRFKPMVFFYRNYYHRFIPTEEVEGCYDEAFTVALQTYDPSMGCSFANYMNISMRRTVLNAMSDYSAIHIPAKLRSKVSKIIAYMDGGSSSPEGRPLTAETIEEAKEYYGWSELNTHLVMKALPILSAGFTTSTVYEDGTFGENLTSGPLVLPEIDESGLDRKYLSKLIDSVITIYFHGTERGVMENIMTAFLDSLSTGHSCSQIAYEMFGYEPNTTTRKLGQLLDVIREYCRFNNIQGSDFF